MQLLYLWVDNYRNFEKQGFHFHPAYEFSYDVDTHKLSMEEKKENDLPANFWGQNISSVTAVVGKNGVGKSSLLKLLDSHDDLTRESDAEVVAVFKNQTNPSVFTVYYKPDGSPHIYIHERLTSLKRVDLNEKKNTQAPDLFRLYTYISGADVFCRSRNDEGYAILRSILRLRKAKKELEVKADVENSSRLEGILSYIDSFLKTRKDFFTLTPVLLKNKSMEQFNDIFNKIIKDGISELLKAPDYDRDIIRLKIYGLFNELSISYSLFEEILRMYLKEVVVPPLEAENFLIEFKDKVFKDYKKELNLSEEEFKELQSNCQNYIKLWKDFNIERSLNGFEVSVKNLSDEDLEKFLELKSFKHTFEVYKGGLSSGEAYYLLMISEVLLKILEEEQSLETRGGSEPLLDNLEEFIIAFDEIDFAMHPTLQKKIFNQLLGLFNTPSVSSYIKFQLIFSTHSPFILSDIPKSNCIFLKKDEESNSKKDEKGNSQVDEGLAISNTFGANIHELLADAFFMEGGLIGDFAKGKINALLKDLIELKQLKRLIELKEKSDEAKTDADQAEIKKLEANISLLKESKQIDSLREIFDSEIKKIGDLKKTAQLVGEPLIRYKLQELVYELTEDTSFIDEEIKRLEQLKQTGRNDKNRNL